MKNKILATLAVLAMLVSGASVAHAYTTVYTNTSWCTGATTLGTLTNQISDTACVPYCAGLDAGCCTTNMIDSDFDVTYTCTAKAQTTVAAKANQNTNNGETVTIRTWASDVISYATTIDLTAGAVTPTTATVGAAVTLTATLSNTGTGSSVSGFTNLFQRATDSSGTNATDIGTYTATALASSGTGTATVSYTFPSEATWYVRACADKNSAAGTGTITESNEANNCGAWTAVVASAAAAPTATISAFPTSGQSSTITWSSTNATTCTGTGFSTGNQTSGTAPVTPTVTTTYSVTCTGTAGSATNSTTVTVAEAPTVTTTAGKLCSGGTFLGSSYDISNSCVTYCSGLTASCCSTLHSYGDSGESYSCIAYSDTTATVDSITTGGCVNGASLAVENLNIDGGGGGGGGEPVCDWTEKSASLISYGPAVSATLVTNPTSVSAGVPALITWDSTNATSCTGTGFSTGGATFGSVEVTPSLTTSYTLSCTNGVGGTATDTETLTVDVFTVTCSATTNPLTVNQSVSWTSAATGGSGSYAYTWSGTDSLSGAASSLSKTYTTLGEKDATLSVTSGGDTITTACTGLPCQEASCTCTSPGCGIIVQEGVSTDVSAGTPVISTGSLFPGGSITFGADLLNIGNNSISSVFRNRFQVDIGNDGTYDVNLDTTGTAGSALVVTYGQKCTGGTIVATDTSTIYGSGDLSNTVQAMCEASAANGQCCSAVVTAGTSGGGGGGGGGIYDNVNLVQSSGDRNVAAIYKSLAATTEGGATYYDVDVTVRSGIWTAATCTTESCYIGTWQAQTGTQFDVPFGLTAGATSPTWSNIPAGTHKVRMCADSPTSQLSESNEGNNCGADYVFSVTGFDFTTGTPGINSGTLLGGQLITFFANITNAPTSYVVSGQCQATVVVTSGGACSIAVSDNGIEWSTTGATIVSAVEPLTDSPSIPPTGSGGLITTSYENYYTPALAADMLANGGVQMRTDGAYSGTPDTPNRICYIIDGLTSYASSYTQTSYNSPGNNSINKWESPIWKKYGASGYNNKLRYTLKCSKPGSPYELSGSYTFTTPLSPGTHTYRLTNNAATNNTCQATIVVPTQTSGLCTLTATPSIIASGGSSILSWILNNVTSITIDQGIGLVSSNSGQSCLPAGSEIPSAADLGGVCSVAGIENIEWAACCSGVGRIHCPAPNEPPEASCRGGGTGTAQNEVTVTPTVTTTYTGTAVTDTSVFNFSGCAPSQFQIDTDNNGSWDTTLDTPACLTSLNLNQSAQIVSPDWTAVVGTHAVRLCANTPATESEGDTTNNCGPSFTFTITPPTQCQDGVDNNSNDLIDTADPACTSGGDATEESHSASALSITSSRTTVKSGSAVTLTWSASEVVAGTCTITSSTGSSWPQAGLSGTQTTSTITGETTYTLSCTSMQTGAATTAQVKVKLTPKYEET